MQTSSNKRGVIVGLFIFLGIVFLVAGILAIGNLHSTFTRKLELSAVFNDVNGLLAGNNIWFSGVKVGTVKKLSFYGESQVLVELKIDVKSQQYIRKDAKIKISTDGLIGNKILVIVGGTQGAGEVEDGDTLAIEEQTSTDEMMRTLQDNNQNLLAITTDVKGITQKIAGGEGALGKLINDEEIYESLHATLASLQRSSAHAEKLTTAVAAYGDKLNNKGTLANELVTDTTIFHDLQASARQLKQMANTAVTATNSLQSATANLSKASDQLDNKNTPVGMLLNDEQAAAHLKGTLKNLESGTEKLDQDLRALQDNFLLRRYFKKKKKADAKAGSSN